MLARAVRAAAMLVFLSGCDPALIYVIPDAPRIKANGGVRYIADLGGGVIARFRATAFNADGEVTLEVFNDGKVPLSFIPSPILIWNGDGKRLEARGCRYLTSPSPFTERETGPSELIGSGERETIDCRFQVDFLGGDFPYPPQSTRMSFAQPGFSRADQALEIRATMVAR
jgi:hypothetical protein